MSDSIKYYYLKLKEDFFNSDAMIVLENLQDGYKYSNILLKLYLKSLKDEGRLMLNGRIPYNTKTLAQVTNHSVGDVELAIKAFEELGLVEILDNGAIYMLDIQNFIGRSSTEADRIRNYRSRIQAEKTNELPDGVQMYNKSTPEIEIEIEKDKRIERKSDETERKDPARKSDRKEIDAFFERIWKAYPEKKGKTQVSLSTRRKLMQVGEDTLLKCIKGYEEDLRVNSWKKPMHGSTFFNGRYEDYLYSEDRPEIVFLNLGDDDD